MLLHRNRKLQMLQGLISPKRVSTFWEAHQQQVSQSQDIETNVAHMRGELRAYTLDQVESRAFIETEIGILNNRKQALIEELNRNVAEAHEVIAHSDAQVHKTVDKAIVSQEKLEEELPKQKDFLSQLLA